MKKNRKYQRVDECMKRNFSASDVMELSVAERIELVEDLWDSIAEVPESVELTEEQKKISVID